MSISIVTYTSITTDLNGALNTGRTPNLSLFSDAAGTTIVSDSNGNPCKDRIVASINYTEPHNTADGAQLVNGFVVVVFNDGSTVTITDNVDTVYYTILAVAFKPRKF